MHLCHDKLYENDELHQLLQQPISVFLSGLNVYKQIDKVNLEEVLRVARKVFVIKNINLAIIGPYKDQSRFEKILK